MKLFISFILLSSMACGVTSMQDKYPALETVQATPLSVTFEENTIYVGGQEGKKHQRDCLLSLTISQEVEQFLPFSYEIDFTRCDHFGNEYFQENIGQYFDYTIFYERITQSYYLLQNGFILIELSQV